MQLHLGRLKSDHQHNCTSLSNFAMARRFPAHSSHRRQLRISSAARRLFGTRIRGVTTHQNQAVPMETLDSTSTRSRHKWYTCQSPCRCWISQAPTRDTSGITTYQTSHSPCRRSIPQAPGGDTHTWHHCVVAELTLGTTLEWPLGFVKVEAQVSGRWECST